MLQKRSTITLAALATVALFACADDDDDIVVTPAPATPPPVNIVDTAAIAGSFDTLVAAIDAAGLTETLSGPGPFTVFAPTDDAFAALPAGTVDTLLLPENQEQLRSILTLHVAEGTLRSTDLAGLSSVITLNGQSLPITQMPDGSLQVGGATVVTPDVPASNGVIHAIDTVLLPQAQMPQ